MTKRLLRASTFLLGAALLAYILYRFGSAQVWLDLRSIGWRFLVIVALEVLVTGASARAWWHIFPSRARRGSFPRLFLLQLAGNALNDSTPGAPVGGEPVKVMLLKEQFPVSVTTASLLSAKLAQALARVLFVILGMLAASWSLKVDRLPVEALAIGFIVTAVGVATFMALQIRGFSGPARRASARLRFLGNWVERIEHGLGRVDEHLQELYSARPSDFVVSIMLGFAGLCVGIVQIWLMMGWMGLRQDWLSSVTIEAFSVLVGLVSFAIPASLGAQEGGKLLIFAALGLPISAGLSMGVTFRLNNVANLLIGFAVLAWLRPHRAFRAARRVETTER
jgi:uncharacterized protein (TIRG00374 family)